MTWLEGHLYPQLYAFPSAERDAALRAAREAPFDIFELIGIALGLIVATTLTRYNAELWDGTDRVAATVVNFIVAIPILFLFVAPFAVRRVRRGLADQLDRRRGP